ncbi:aldehyde dehydrogenase family protein [Phycicoccus flavus]|uniref:aldehyde dehydrogenase family protein n=1 Tax=Phycicoccus flavus TaxID=2502783 RepID=UPI000FEC085B|nr:aldehyde dehydrogenase family protein [Phycicoccus flavus]NHA66999.1 aldehyde dehydrogenase family protein [Phycicoccus flavus]
MTTTTTRPVRLPVEGPARGDGPNKRHLPRSVAWHGTTLEGDALRHAVAITAAALAELGVDASGTVVLEVDDTGRGIVTLLAAASVGAGVVLVDDLARLRLAHPGTVPQDAVRVTLRAAPGGTAHDLRAVFGPLEGSGPHPAQWAARTERTDADVDLGAWFARSRALGIFSSGTTTGEPTLVWKSGTSLLENARATAAALGYHDDDTLLPLLPLAGQYGSSAVLVAAVVGAGLVTCSRTRLGEVLRTVERHGVTCLDATPVLYRALLDELDKRPAGTARLDAVRLFGVGGEGLSPRLQDDARARLHRPLTDGYGLTQLGNVAFASTPGRGALTPVEPYRLAVLDDAGVPCADGRLGRVLVGRTDGRPPVEADPQAWFDTGDVGRLTADGLVVLGRRGMISRGGSLVSLAWVEAALTAEGVEAVAVPDESGETARYWLFVQDPLHRPREVWRRRVAGLLAEDQRPDHLRVLGTLPVDSSGKVSRARLRALAEGLGEAQGPLQCRADSPAGRLRATVRENRQELIALIEETSDRATAHRDYWSLVNVLNHADGELGLYTRPPRVPVDVFFPRNALLESFAIYCLVPSLWASEVRLRPARGTETVMARVVELLGAAAPCPVALDTSTQAAFVETVASRPSLVLFTGRRSNAEEILQALGERHVLLFFGRGVNPIVVNRGADLRAAAKDIVISRLFNGGQDCLAPDLVLAHDDVVDTLVPLVVEAAAEYVRANDGALAPLLKDETLLHALGHLTTHAEAIVSGGEVDYRGRTFSPAVLRTDDVGRAAPVEHFAPIVTMAGFGSVGEVLDLLRTRYYLENGFGVSLYAVEETAARTLCDHYMVAMDQSLADAATPYEPFGGHGVESGFVAHRGGRVLGPVNITQTAVRFGSTIGDA